MSVLNTRTNVFGTGSVIATIAGLQPVKFGTLQDIEIDISAGVAELYGQNQFPVAVGRGKGKITGKAKLGEFNTTLFNNLFFGGTLDTVNYTKLVEAEVHSVGSSITTATVTNLGSSNVNDMGIYYTATGVQLTPSTAVSAAGLYSFASSGVVTTSSLETAATSLQLSYTYLSSAGGNSLTVSNQLMGQQPVFALQLWEGFGPTATRNNFDIQLNNCISSKFTMPMKNSDFMIVDFEFSAFADANGNIMTLGDGN